VKIRGSIIIFFVKNIIRLRLRNRTRVRFKKGDETIFYSCNPRNSRVKKKGILSGKEISGDK